MKDLRESIRLALVRRVGTEFGARANVARRAGLSTASLTNLLKHGRGLTLDNIDRVLDAVGATWDEVMREIGARAVAPAGPAPAPTAAELSYSGELVRKLFEAFKTNDEAVETLYAVLTSSSWVERQEMAASDIWRLIEPLMRRGREKKSGAGGSGGEG